jgi:hypothetical protein
MDAVPQQETSDVVARIAALCTVRPAREAAEVAGSRGDQESEVQAGRRLIRNGADNHAVAPANGHAPHEHVVRCSPWRKNARALQHQLYSLRESHF